MASKIKSERGSESGPSVDARAVAAYLESHPHFFDRHQKALAGLRLHHESGSAVSLIERQIAILRSRNEKMQRQLNSLLDVARVNESRVNHLNELAQCLIGAESLNVVAQGVRASLTRSFQVDEVFLGIRGSAPESMETCGLRFITGRDPLLKMFRDFFRTGKTECGPLDAEKSALLFPECHVTLRSAAMVPLDRAAKLGVLVLAGSDQERFTPNMGAWFLEMTAQLVASACRAHLPAQAA